MKNHFLLLLMLLIAPSALLANECDCTQVIGKCVGDIKITPTKSDAGLYGAELTFSANASQCAKIDYWIDNMPAMTILPNGRYAQDNVLGISKKPLGPNNITYKSCLICKTQQQVNKEQAEKDAIEQAQDDAVRDQTQAEINALINDAVSQGVLNPSTYGGTTEEDSAQSALLKLQSTLQESANNQEAARQQQELQEQLEQQQQQQYQQVQQQQQAQQEQEQHPQPYKSTCTAPAGTFCGVR